MTGKFTSRRAFLSTTSIVGTIGVAGCLGGSEGGEFPNENIRIIVPYGSGTNTDADARAFAPELEDELGVSVSVENLEGAGGLRGLGELYSADDGHDVGFGYVPSNPISALTNPPGWDFGEIGGVGSYSHYAVSIIANPDYGIESVEDLFSRYSNGDLEQVGGLSLGHTWHVIAMLLRENNGFDWDSWVNYGGSGEIVRAVTADEVPVALVSEDNVIPAHEEGDVDYICCLGSSGTELTPSDVPTWVDDAGNESIDYMSMVSSVVFAPPNATDEQQSTLEDAFRSVVESDAWAEYSEDRQQIISWSNGSTVASNVQKVMNDLPDRVDLDNIGE